MERKIKLAIDKFKLNLKNLNVFTEAASGNFVVTPVIAALAGANVVAITKNSKYASIEKVITETNQLSEKLKVKDRIQIIFDDKRVDYSQFDIITNTGFVRPIGRSTINKLKSSCVVPLMWEPWEYREQDLDLLRCHNKGIKVYGTNEDDSRLKTMNYIGYIVLYQLLKEKYSPFSSKILIVGNQRFTLAIQNALSKNNYSLSCINDYSQKVVDIDQYQVVVIAEHERNKLILGCNSYLESLNPDTLIIHICGHIDPKGLQNRIIPEHPANFGYMSFTADYIDNMAVIDLHTAGLKVAEGMINANKQALKPSKYKKYMETNYPALAFDDKKFW